MPKPPPHSPDKKQRERFCAEYLKDLNVSAAARRTGVSSRNAWRWLTDEKEVQERIAELMAERTARTKIEADDVLRHVLAIATVDPNELIEIRRVCCRHCHGIDHRYQYTDVHELARAHRVFYASDEGLVEAFEHGGTGFVPANEPNPACPACGGDGTAYVHVKDTRYLSPAARSLYAGAKQTKDGIEVRFNSRDKHLELLMRHLGLLNDKLEVNADAALVEKILAARKRARGG